MSDSLFSIEELNDALYYNGMTTNTWHGDVYYPLGCLFIATRTDGSPGVGEWESFSVYVESINLKLGSSPSIRLSSERIIFDNSQTDDGNPIASMKNDNIDLLYDRLDGPICSIQKAIDVEVTDDLGEDIAWSIAAIREAVQSAIRVLDEWDRNYGFLNKLSS